MRLLASIVVVALSFPVAAECVPGRLLHTALHDVPKHLCLDHDINDIAIADATVGGQDALVEHMLRKWHSRSIAEEIIESYRQNADQPERIDSCEDLPFRVLPLDEFVLGDGLYDWQKLNARYPGVRAVVTLSRPAVDSQEVYAVVRYEVITDEGPHRGSLFEIEKQSDGSWESKHGIIGGLRLHDAVIRSKASSLAKE